MLQVLREKQALLELLFFEENKKSDTSLAADSKHNPLSKIAALFILLPGFTLKSFFSGTSILPQVRQCLFNLKKFFKKFKMTLVRFVIALVFSLVGISGSIAFMLLKNHPAAILAIITAFINCVATHIHFLNYRNLLQDWYAEKHLKQIGCFGFYSFAFSTSALIYFTVVEIIKKIPILPIEDSVVLPIIWSLISIISGLILFCYGRYYSRQDHSVLQDTFPVQQEITEPQEITA